ncbi:hypothetical protein NLI96_g10987 [Meripilus lineatus]|uniref:Hydrophobin n=1 Tax=Meripilus lineatus TaxID=2056292 RepID=A0AAD5Y8T4_9APHY|nr:hypothetical protein NLI96_g10987 [Physisporinus lineatus]
MFAHRAQIIISALLLFIAFATASPAPAPIPSGETATQTVTVTATATPTSSSGNCNTGPMQCCNSVQQANSAEAQSVLGPLGVAVAPVNALVGFNCSPITAIGLGNSGCRATPVCCQNNNYGGLVSIGCIVLVL